MINLKSNKGEIMKKYCDLIRVKHWTKNLLIFLPLFFSGTILNTNKLFLSIFAFLVFCCSASIIYIINDIFDLKKDRNHPIKKNRPLANNSISKKNAYLIIIILFILFNFFSIFLYNKMNNVYILIVPFIYICINLLYSAWLKNIPIIDVIVIVTGFVLRVIYGGICSNIFVSKYLYLLIIFGGFYLAFGKRRGEMIKTDSKSRAVLSKYNKNFLDKNMYVSYTISIVCYILWCVDNDNINEYIFWTIPILMTIFQLYSLDIENDSFADPVDVILNNKILMSVILLYVLLVIILLYFL